MKPVRYGVYSLLFVLSLVASLVVPSGIASATSDYDSNYRTTDSVVLENNGWSPYYAACPAIDYTTNWMSAMVNALSDNAYNSNNSQADDYLTSWETASTSGRWAVSQEEGGYNGHTYSSIVIYWTEDTSLALSWTYPDQVIATGGSSLHSVALRNKNVQTSSSGCAPYAILSMSGGSISSRADAGGISRYKNLFVYSDYLNIPGGYEGELIRTDPPAVTHAGLGDSYSSAEGNPQFEYGTDVSNVNGCHRSPQAYTRLLQYELNLGPTAFAACSGATTANITDTGQWNEPPQIDALTSETEDVTLIVGGNDADFVGYAMGCSVACGPGSGPYNTIMGKINDPDFKDALVDTYEAILGVNEDLDLYVADYPYLAEEDATTCWGLDFSGAYDVQTALNDVIFDAVVEVGLNSSRIFMVQTNYPGSPFEGGELCGSGTPLFHGLVAPPDLEYSLHPNVAGQAAYAEVFEEAMS